MGVSWAVCGGGADIGVGTAGEGEQAWGRGVRGLLDLDLVLRRKYGGRGKGIVKTKERREWRG